MDLIEEDMLQHDKTGNVIWQAISQVLIEFPARRMGFDRLIARLEKSALAIEKRGSKLRGRPNECEVLAHVIGIERWGQRRLRVALGEGLALEEYDTYRPEQQKWESLLSLFLSTRQDTVSLSKSLRMAGVDPTVKIVHNQFGRLSVLGWLSYLNLHASLEILRLS